MSNLLAEIKRVAVQKTLDAMDEVCRVQAASAKLEEQLRNAEKALVKSHQDLQTAIEDAAGSLSWRKDQHNIVMVDDSEAYMITHDGIRWWVTGVPFWKTTAKPAPTTKAQALTKESK